MQTFVHQDISGTIRAWCDVATCQITLSNRFYLQPVGRRVWGDVYSVTLAARVSVKIATLRYGTHGFS